MKGLTVKHAALALVCLVVATTTLTAKGTDSTQTVATADSTSSRRPKTREDSVLVVKHQFNHREQIIAGSVIMSCLVGILVVMNNYNPR